MNEVIVEFYESVFKNEVMRMTHDGTNKTLKELAEEFVNRDEAHSHEIHEAYLNVIKEVIGR